MSSGVGGVGMGGWGGARIRSCEMSTRCGVFDQGLFDSGGRVMIYEGEQAPSDCSVWEFGFRFGNHMSVGVCHHE